MENFSKHIGASLLGWQAIRKKVTGEIVRWENIARSECEATFFFFLS